MTLGMLRVLALPLLVPFASISMALPAAGDDSLDAVVVTANRIAEPVDDVLASVTVLTRATIEARQATSVQELLRGEAGIEVSNNGGLGKVSSVYMRGTNSDHVLVLVDGVPLSSATVGSTAFQYLPVSEIDRIEIVRGPRSSLYGSDALGGVIQIFTRRGTGPFSPELSLSAGSHGLREVAGGASGAAEQISYSVSGSYESSNGYDSCLGAPFLSPASPGGGCFTAVPYDDRFHNASVSGRIAYHPSDNAQIEAFALRASGATDFHSDFQNREYFVQQATGVSGDWSPLEQLRLSARVGQSRDEALDVAVGLAVSPEFPVAPSTFDTVRLSGSFQADFKVRPTDTVTAGVDYLRDKVDSDTQYAVTARRDTGEFAQYLGQYGAQHVALSVRHDDNQQFGGRTTGGAAWGYRLDNNLQFSASYATAFKAPTFNELYYPFYGTPTLRPETSRSVEVGVDQTTAWGRWSVHGYETHINDLIDTDPNSFTAQNIDRSLIRGVESQIERKWLGWSAGVTANWLNPRSRSNDETNGNLLPRRAQASGRLEVGRHFEHLDLAARFNIEGKRFDDLANTARLGGYSTTDLLATWRISPAIAVQAKLANLTGHHYETALYYPQDGRNYLVTVRVTPLAGR
jgi:vitamin B12 transporter